LRLPRVDAAVVATITGFFVWLGTPAILLGVTVVDRLGKLTLRRPRERTR
jgi:hypothetical protein